MNFIELILRLQAKARAIAAAFINLDFSTLDKKLLGFASILDVVAVVLAAYIIKEVIVYMISFSMNMLKSLTHSIYQYSSTFIAAFASIFLRRIYYTLVYLYQRPIILDFQDMTFSFLRDRVKFLPPLKK